MSSYVAANAGWELVECGWLEPESDIYKTSEPIVAWEITDDGTRAHGVSGVVVDQYTPTFDMPQGHEVTMRLLRTPDGRLFSGDGCEYSEPTLAMMKFHMEMHRQRT